MVNELMYVFLFLFSVLLSSVSQILLKQSAGKEHDNLIKEYLNFRVAFAYALFFLAAFMTMFAYRGISLSTGLVLEATGYFWVALFGMLFLKEPIKRQKWVGLGIILCGILIFIR